LDISFRLEEKIQGEIQESEAAGQGEQASASFGRGRLKI
jgi:hypothetical protein